METIQFIAHHDLQSQVFQGILPFLADHRCIVSIGQNVIIEAGVTVVVVVDHLAFQSNIKKNSTYKLVHLCHDLADLDIYAEEYQLLKEFDLILCPSFSHYKICQNLFPQIPAFPVGWAKSMPTKKLAFNDADQLNRDNTIIFAPTEIADLNWRAFLEVFEKSPYHFIIKNHVYWNFETGNEPPLGQEIRYGSHRRSLLEMERYVKSKNLENVELIDRRANISDFFYRAKFLLTDSSSAALEFVENGISVEFGLLDPSLGVRVPEVSLVDNRVHFIEEADLLTKLRLGKLGEISGSFGNSDSLELKVQMLNGMSLSADAVSAFLIVFSRKRKISDLRRKILSVSPKVLNLRRIIVSILKSLGNQLN